MGKYYDLVLTVAVAALYFMLWVDRLFIFRVNNTLRKHNRELHRIVVAFTASEKIAPGVGPAMLREMKEPEKEEVKESPKRTGVVVGQSYI